MSQKDIDAEFDDIEEAFDELDDQEDLHEDPAVAQTEQGDDGPCCVEATAGAEIEPTKEEEDEQPAAENEEEEAPAETQIAAPTHDRKGEEVTVSDGNKETATEVAKPARKRPAFKKPAARKLATEDDTSKGAKSGTGASKVSADQANPDSIKAADAAPDGEKAEAGNTQVTDDAPDRETTKTKKPEKVPLKSKKIPVARALKAGPPDPCNYTAPKEAIGDEEKPAKKASKGATKKAKSDDPKLPSAKTAYFFFAADLRGPLKSEHADLSFGEISKKLGEMWNGLSVDEKQPYLDQAEEDKARVEKLIQADPSLLALREEKKGGRKSKVAKSDKRVGVTKSGVMKESKQVAKKATKKTQKAGDAAENEDPAAGSDAKTDKDHGKGRASKWKANRAILHEEQEQSDEDYDWEADHEDCDWAAHPAECIVAVTNKQKYVVKRKGLPFNEFGLVPVNAAKRHCSGQVASTSESGLLTAEMINEFEQFKKEFSNETVDHTYSRELDLDDLENGSKLEVCAFLGDLRREGVLAKAGKKLWEFDECTAQFSVMTLSFVVQRLVQAAVMSATKPLQQQIENLKSQKGFRTAADQVTEE